jgi:hypothetical protein
MEQDRRSKQKERKRRNKHLEIDLAQPPKALIGGDPVTDNGAHPAAEPQSPRPENLGKAGSFHQRSMNRLPFPRGARQNALRVRTDNRRACPRNKATGVANTLSEQKSVIALLPWVTWGVLPSLQ